MNRTYEGTGKFLTKLRLRPTKTCLARINMGARRSEALWLANMFWIALKKFWDDWRLALESVQPETVVVWQRKPFKRYWW